MFHIKGIPIAGGGSTKFVLSDRWIVYTKSRKQLLHRKYILYETGCMFSFPYLCRDYILRRYLHRGVVPKINITLFYKNIYSVIVEMDQSKINHPKSFRSSPIIHQPPQVGSIQYIIGHPKKVLKYVYLIQLFDSIYKNATFILFYLLTESPIYVHIIRH